MLSQIQGRLNRRYVSLFVAFCLVLLLWQSFHSSSPEGWIGSKLPNGQDVHYVPSSYDWGQVKITHPVQDMMSPPEGKPKSFPPIQAEGLQSKQDDIAEARKQTIKNAFIKTWSAYKTYAWTKDELMPLSGKGKQSLHGWGVQLVDALDTLWIMDLKDDFHLAVKEVASIDWGKTSDTSADLFEVTIRYLGGLLSAYELSQESILLKKAVEIGDLLYAGFDTPNRLPAVWIDFELVKSGKLEADTDISGAGAGSMSMEFTRLSQLTGDPKYYDATERVKKFFYRTQNTTHLPGLWPNRMNLRDETLDKTMFTLGAGSDSQYEYLPKMHALLGGLDSEYLEMMATALDTAQYNILFRPMTPKDEDILLAGNLNMRPDGTREFSAEMQHLSCFAGGMYAFAGKLLEREDYVDLGSQLASGCVWGYDSFPTNIMPENSEFVACENLTGPCAYDHPSLPNGRDQNLPDGYIRIRDTRYILRPEAIESVFYMWRITGNQAWRDAAWRMWEGISKETETELAYASLSNVRTSAGEKEDGMESFWLGETVKYFYLVFESDNVLSLDDWVFNTEAHPLRRPGRE